MKHLALFNDKGKLKIVDDYYYTDSATETFIGFFDTNAQEIHLPTPSKEKKPDNEKFIVVTTSDFVEVGIKLSVIFQIENKDKAAKALSRFRDMKAISEHIQDVVNSSMLNIIQKHTSTDYLISHRASAPAKAEVKLETESGSFTPKPMPVAPVLDQTPKAPFETSEQNQVREALEKDLAKWGITLQNMTIYEAKFLNEELAKKFAEQALTTAITNTKVAVIGQQTLIAQAEAESKKMVDLIDQTRKNTNLVESARAALEAVEFDAQALERKAAAEAKAVLIRAEAEAKAIEMKGSAQNTVLEQTATLFEKNPKMHALKLAEASANAISSIRNLNVTSKDFPSLLTTASSFFSPFNSERLQPSLSQEDEKEKTGTHRKQLTSTLG